MRHWPLLLLPVLTIAAPAQSDPPTRRPTTTVSGHVYCADTNAPARMASVMLEPVRLVERADTVTNASASSHAEITMTAVQTTLDGSFAISKVIPGSYYVIAYKAGYLSPLATFRFDVRPPSVRRGPQTHRRHSSKNHRRSRPACID